MVKQFLIILFFSSISLFSDEIPISLQKNWFGKAGKHLSFSASGDWTQYKELIIRSKDFKDLKESDFIQLSFYNSFHLSKEDLAKQTESLSVILPFLSNAFEVYLNGEILVKGGSYSENKITKDGFRRNVHVKFPNSKLKDGLNEIIVIVTGMNGEEIALYTDDKTTIDTISKHEYQISERVTLMLLFMYAFVGFYHLLLFLKRTQEKYNFFFGMFCLSLSIYIYTRSTAVYETNLDPMLITRIEYIDLFHITAFSMAFFENFFKGRIGLLSKFSFAYIWLLSFSMLFVSRGIASKVLLAWQLFTLISFIYLVYLMIHTIVKKHQDSKRLFFGFIILLCSSVWDIIGAMGLSKSIQNYGLMQYGFFTFVMGIAVVLANRFLRVHKEVEELNATLEKKVIERTKELQRTLTEVNALKLQQDGDYFLTSLLIKPLMVNHAKSSKIKIDFYIKQKKTFDFKGKTYQIGGDMCIANNIRLRGKNYCVFINGDAMGKSIQGAGGALVLGVVFRSIIERSKIFKPNMELFPEQWIKICFIELQNVFVSFDGSMLVSIVMGLIEENTGALYFLNAEHPWTVLYRDKKASFIEQELYLHKVGMLGLDSSLKIQTFQMQAGDSIIIGSDGRDDIMLGMDLDGQRNINEDGNNFLKHVEKGQGELEGITDSILKQGEFTDDYTLIKISYIETNQETVIIPEKFSEFVSKGEIEVSNKQIDKAIFEFKKALALKKDKDVYLRILNLYYIEKRYKEFVQICEEFLNEFPIENEEFYKMSYALKFCGELSLAADYGESLKLRDPFNVKNLLNLSDLYRKTKNFARANKLLTDVLNLEPENQKAKELKEMIAQDTKI
jgi:tetratricopeptide (TPR) repeat protein